MGERLFVVDAFTTRPFRGNPAAVCVLREDRDDGWLSRVALEMNLSETAFLRAGAEAWSLRWFTPTIEVDLCGHATLASAHALWEQGLADAGKKLRFETRSGVLTAERRGEAIELDFPAEPASPCSAPPGLLDSLGVSSARSTGRNRLDFLVELESEAALAALSPDFVKLAEVTRPARGVIVTAGSDAAGRDFVSRYFAPSAGIDEDPVTGSAHCCLGPFWGERLGKSELTGEQVSARGGTVGVRLSGGGRVALVGRAVTIWRGELL